MGRMSLPFSAQKRRCVHAPHLPADVPLTALGVCCPMPVKLSQVKSVGIWPDNLLRFLVNAAHK